jgi:menaquinone-dependent protoporphyrinogen oxidase
MARILVAYVSRTGSTAEIAQAVARELQAAGHSAETAEIGKTASPAGYAAVVIGGPMYMGRVDSRMAKFTKQFASELAGVPVAAFVVCLAPVSKDPDGVAFAQKALTTALGPVRPVAAAVFAGRLDPERLSWFQQWITRKVNSPVGDFRDWGAITAWSRGLPAAMKI